MDSPSSLRQFGHRRQATGGNNLLNPDLSLGTCYFGPNKPAASNFIPCGNYAYGNFACCQAGDNCLASNACFNYRGGITYSAGCTDPTYSSSSCPNKGSFADQQWSGLVVCDKTKGTWANCKEADGSTTVQDANSDCNCDGKTPSFTDSAVLKALGALPLAQTQSIAWSSGYTPTATVPTTTPGLSTSQTSAASSTTPTSSTIPTSSSTTTSPGGSTQAPVESGSSSGLSQGATIGIGVGIGVGALLIIAIGIMLYLLKKKRRSNEQHSIKSSPRTGGRGSGEMGSVQNRPVSAWQGSNAGGMDSPAMGGFKSELPADEKPRPPPVELDTIPPVELDSTPVTRGMLSPNATGSTAVPPSPMTATSEATDHGPYSRRPVSEMGA